MSRNPLAVVLAVTLSSLFGCAGTWDRVSSRQFRDAPMKTLYPTTDPMLVLRTKVEGSERASAMRRLEEPIRRGRSQAEQDEALQILEQSATEHPSPVVRTAAIEALGRFTDPRVIPLLAAAYYHAEGKLATNASAHDPAPPVDNIRQVAGRSAPPIALELGAPVGFAPEFATAIRTSTIAALSKSDKPEAAEFLAKIATGEMRTEGANADDRDVRLAAVRGLGQMKQKEAVVALARVLQTDGSKDVVMSNRAHEGLVNLTGMNLPPEPEKWNAVIQTGFEIQR